jgi:hypothetical protein
MTDQKNTQKFDYEIVYATDRNGGKETLLLNEIPYDVFKAAKSSFADNADKAMRIIIAACAEEGSKLKALAHFEKGNFVAITSIESGIAELITPIPAELKKK